MSKRRAFTFFLVVILVASLICSAFDFDAKSVIHPQEYDYRVEPDELFFLQWEYKVGKYPNTVAIGRQIVAVAYEDELVMLLTVNGSVISRVKISNVTDLMVGDYNLDGDEEVVVSRTNETLVIDMYGNVIERMNISGLIIHVRPLVIINSSYIFIQGIGNLNNSVSVSSKKQVACMDIDGDGEIEIVFRANSSIFLVDGSNIKKINSKQLSGSNILALGDFNGDGSYEIVTQDGCSLIFMNLNGSIIAQVDVRGLDRFNLSQLSVGDIDYDGSDEVVFLVFDNIGTVDLKEGVSYLRTWYAESYYEPFIIADVDGDGLIEFMIIGLNGHVPIYDDYGECYYTYLEYYYDKPYAIWDFDNDTKLEIIAPYHCLWEGSGIFCYELYRSRPIIQWWGSNGSPDNLNVGLIDSDRDGLSDYSERIIGSNPFDPDTDNDGIKDSLEIVKSGNPFANNNLQGVIDSDMDGLSDYEEKLLGTNPYDRDTDDDGFPDGIDLAPLNPIVPGIYILLSILLILGILFYNVKSSELKLLVSYLILMVIYLIALVIQDVIEEIISEYLDKFLKSLDLQTAFFYISLIIVLIILVILVKRNLRNNGARGEITKKSESQKGTKTCPPVLVGDTTLFRTALLISSPIIYYLWKAIPSFVNNMGLIVFDYFILFFVIISAFMFAFIITSPFISVDAIKSTYLEAIKNCENPRLLHLFNLMMLFPDCVKENERMKEFIEKYSLIRKLLILIASLAGFFTIIGIFMLDLVINLWPIIQSSFIIYILASLSLFTPLVMLIIIIKRIVLMDRELRPDEYSIFNSIIKCASTEKK